ncbi:cell division protein ZipA C-terminal FtsZ-binding domain-containing protein [Steroidobacter cummioxidans]|uniref:cell division protein ZipA C-terminal FtsZ-binding domain-containing protein n=1 Tax=Steroidobacter cummioxidans TaxID=1803913 RepID=UPI000E31214D|nr:cell division protein ZipA C-terminal FtsZ-binding domain-containing protein [Steroidobacter cummioxidans]
MSELRWILIGFGIVLLAGIYLWGRRGAAAVAEDVALRSRPDPALQPHGFTEVRREPAFQREDVPDYEEEPPYEEADEPDPADEVKQFAEDYDDTAVRPVRPSSPRVEARVARGEPPRPPVREAPPAPSPESKPLPDFRRGRVEPTLGTDTDTEELPVQSPTSTAIVTPAPTLSSSDMPAPRRSPERRKILSLRLSSAPQKIEGAKLQEVLAEELLSHGKYGIFHREHSDGQAIFSIASMVEPGTFDPETMNETLYPGVTLFAQLPGPVPGMHALNELVACARRLHQSLGGVLQDDRGVPLTVHRIERMKQEVREFERPPGRGNHE